MSSFTPTKRGGAEKVSAMLKEGTTSFEVVLPQELEVLAIVMGPPSPPPVIHDQSLNGFNLPPIMV